VLYLWGLGFSDRPGTPADAATLIDWLTTSADPRYRVTLVGGVPTHWRTLDGDSKRDAAWAGVYRSFDVLSPWTVGRFGDDAGADAYRATSLAADLAALHACRVPGQPQGRRLEPDPAPRGRQVSNAVGAGATMLKTAMFDEVDEVGHVCSRPRPPSSRPAPARAPRRRRTRAIRLLLACRGRAAMARRPAGLIKLPIRPERSTAGSRRRR
jgi:hypothetical protein